MKVRMHAGRCCCGEGGDPFIGCCFRRIKFLTGGGTVSLPPWTFSPSHNPQTGIDAILAEDQENFPLHGQWRQTSDQFNLRQCEYVDYFLPNQPASHPTIYPIPMNVNGILPIPDDPYSPWWVVRHELTIRILRPTIFPSVLRGIIQLVFHIGIYNIPGQNDYVGYIRLFHSVPFFSSTSNVDPDRFCHPSHPSYTSSMYGELFHNKPIDRIQVYLVHGGAFGNEYNQTRTLNNVETYVLP